MSDTPKVSVILPVYNAEAYLAEAIDSILDQSLTDLELIAVDDGSSDASVDMLNAYAAKDARVQVITQENGGVSRACNIAIDAARGQYVARMDSDDIAWKERFAKQAAYLDAHSDVVAIGTQFRLIDPEGRLLKQLELPLDHETIDARHAGGEGALSICNPSSMMRRDALLKVGKYNNEFRSAHDIELFLRLAEVGKLANLEDTLLDYRQHGQSIGYSSRNRQRHFAWKAAFLAAERRGLSFDVPEPDGNAANVSQADVLLKWGWWALMAGNVSTARFYARKVLFTAPLSFKSWHFALFALRGH